MEVILNGKKYELNQEQKEEYLERLSEKTSEDTKRTELYDSKKETVLKEMGLDPIDDDRVGY